MYHQPKLTERQLQLKITNIGIHAHDLTCDCQEPSYHLCRILLKQLSGEFTKQQKQNLKQCLGLDQDTTDGDTENIGKDLEELFKEDTDDDGAG